MSKIKDPALYRKMAEPFDSETTVRAAFDAFADEVRTLREKYRLRDVVVIVSVAVRQGEEEHDLILQTSNGASDNVLPMLAASYASERDEAKRRLRRLDEAVEDGDLTRRRP